MKTYAFLLTFLLCCFCSFAQKSDSSVLFTQKIEWSQFQGAPNSDSFAARILTSINLDIEKVSIWNETILFRAYAVMNPYKSWVKPAYDDNYTLQHEQTHFNITEICARGLQSELNRMKIKSRKSPLIQATFSKWQKEMEELQKLYDLETKGGNDSATQMVWNDRILNSLTRTE